MFRAKPVGEKIFYPNIVRAARAAALSSLVSRGNGLTVVFFESFSDCEFAYARLKYFMSLRGFDFSLKVLPAHIDSAQSDAGSFDALCERTGTLNAIAESDSVARRTVVLTTPEAFFDNAPAPQASRNFELCGRAKIPMDELKLRLVDYGYYNEVLCESPGQFSVRGGVVDIYPIASAFPIRLDFFGDEIDSIRALNPDTQLADEKIG